MGSGASAGKGGSGPGPAPPGPTTTSSSSKLIDGAAAGGGGSAGAGATAGGAVGAGGSAAKADGGTRPLSYAAQRRTTQAMPTSVDPIGSSSDEDGEGEGARDSGAEDELDDGMRPIVPRVDGFSVPFKHMRTGKPPVAGVSPLDMQRAVALSSELHSECYGDASTAVPAAGCTWGVAGEDKLVSLRQLAAWPFSCVDYC